MAQPGLIPIAIVNGSGVGKITPPQLAVKWRVYQLTVTLEINAPVGSSWLPSTAPVFGCVVDVNGIPVMSYVLGRSPLCASGDPYIDVGGHEVMNVNIDRGPVPALGLPLTITAQVSYQFDELPAG